MKKILKLRDLDCAHCADKIERGVGKIKDVNEVCVNFMAQKMVIDIDDDKFDETMKEVIKVAKDIEPDCEILL